MASLWTGCISQKQKLKLRQLLWWVSNGSSDSSWWFPLINFCFDRNFFYTIIILLYKSKSGNMRKFGIRILILMTAMLTVIGSQAQTKPASPSDTTRKTPPKSSIADKVKSSRKIEGLLTLYQDTATGSVQLYIKKNQLGKEFIYQSFSMGGPPQLFLNQNMIRTTWIFRIRKAFDKIEFAQENTNFYYDSTNAISKAANVDVTEAIFYSDKVAGEDSLGYLISADGLFLS